MEDSFNGVKLIKEAEYYGIHGNEEKLKVRFKIPKDADKEYPGIYFNGSERAFGKFYTCYFSPNKSDDDVFSIYFRMMQAWSVDGDFIVHLAKKYKLDMAIDAYERSCEDETHVEVVGGKVLMNCHAEHKHKDWNFEVPNPEYGV